MSENKLKSLDIYLANPRSFCFGVVNAIEIANKALNQYGAPIYVRHEIVHNKHVVEDLKSKGVVFIEDFNEVLETTKPVIISAHGASKKVFDEAQELGLNVIDATCPLVKKVHKEIINFYNQEKEIIVIGKANHQEIIGTVGQLEDAKNVYIINSIEEAKNLNIKDANNLGFVSQTTLSVDETKEIIGYLITTYPKIEYQKDICLATTQRQSAIKELCKKTNFVIIIGSKNSSNSKNLQKVAIKNNAHCILVDDYKEVDFNEIKKHNSIGISAGASAPEHLVSEIVNELEKYYEKINVFDVK